MTEHGSDAEDEQLRRALELSREAPELPRLDADAEAEDLAAAIRLSLGGTSTPAPMPPQRPSAGEAAPSRAGGGLGAGRAGFRGVQDALDQGKWSYERVAGGHRIYVRWVLRVDDLDKREKQTWSCPSTPSDQRSYLNMRADLRRMDDGIYQALVVSDEDGQEHGDEAPNFAALHALHQQKNQLERELTGVENEIATWQSQLDA